MKLMSIKLNIGILLFLVFLWGEGIRAQLVPTKGLSLYSEYRREILNLGWKPKPSVVPDYVQGWPEIICGNRLCSAAFISPNGKQVLTLSVWFDVKPGRTDYYVAPAFDIVEVEQAIKWSDVPGTNKPSVMYPNPSPAYLGTNTLIRRSDQISFDAIIDEQYIRYSGNCRTKMLYRLKIGTVDDNR
jgi:hypothetical protein